MIKLRILKGDYPELSKWTLNVITTILIKTWRERLDTQREEEQVHDCEVEIRVRRP